MSTGLADTRQSVKEYIATDILTLSTGRRQDLTTVLKKILGIRRCGTELEKAE